MNATKKWWKEAVIYQIYPRSFQDSNGDGIGDLQGIVSRLDYIRSLGVDAVWITPVFESPGFDNGYDISDYQAIQPEFGTMEHMDALIAGLHERGLRLVLDMVINHTSDQHPWFRQAMTGRENPYYPYYHWWPAENGEPPERCGFFDPEGKAWHYNEPTNSWYLHYFSKHQPDLNWGNPKLRQEIYNMFRFWLDKGVDGFRLDAVTFIAKDNNYPPFDPIAFKEKFQGDWGHYYAGGPHLHDYLHEIHEVLATYDAVSIAEAPGVTANKALDYVGDERKELDMLCHFEGIIAGYVPGEFKRIVPGGYDRPTFKKIYSCWSEVYRNSGWGALYLGNHDQPRMVSRWGDDATKYRDVSAKLLFTFLCTMRSTPFIYAGDELGMTNIRFTTIDEYQDIETRQKYNLIAAKGGDTAAFLKDQQNTARDNSRTPFQWDASPGAGFTTGSAWLKINPNHNTINRTSQENDPHSVLNYVRRLNRLRKEYTELVYGDYTLLESPEGIYAYTRKSEARIWTILLNLTGKTISYHLDPGTHRLALSNYEELQIDGTAISMQPWMAVAFKSE